MRANKYLPLQALMATGAPNDNNLPYSGNYFTDMNGNAVNGDIGNYNFDPNANARDGSTGLYNLKPEIAMPQDFMRRFGGDAPTGPMTLADLIKYTGGGQSGVTEAKFNQLNPQAQQGILSDPGTFLRGQMGYGPKASKRIGISNQFTEGNPFARYTVGQGFEDDLLKFGGEGGSKDPSKIYWDKNVGLVQDPQNYTPDSNNNDFLQYAPYLVGGMAGLAGAAYGLTAAQAGAVTGGVTGAVSGFNSTGEGNFGDVVKGGAKGAASGYAGGWLGQNGGQFVKDFMPTGTSPIVNNAITGAAKGGLGSLMNGGNVGQGLLKGGITGGLNSAVGAGVNSTGASGGWEKLLNAGGNFLAGSATNNLFGNSNKNSFNSSNSNNYSPSNNTGGTMANGNGYDWSSLFDGIGSAAGAASPFISAWQTNKNINQTDQAYGDAKNLILNPSADQQKYRTQLATLMDNPGSMESSPLYQSMLDQGMNAVNRTASAKGQLGSGNRLADLMSAGQKTAANYYFPQQQALASLSGITGDSGQRAAGARTLLEGNSANTEMKMSRLKDLLGGFGAKTPTQQLLESMYGGGAGGGGGGVGSLLGQAAGAVKNWFGGSSDWTPGNYQGFNNSIDPGMANWDNQVSNWGGGSDWWNNGGSSLTAPTDYSSGIDLSGPSQDYSSWDNLLKGGSMWGAY